jgi:hypothetical protein
VADANLIIAAHIAPQPRRVPFDGNSGSGLQEIRFRAMRWIKIILIVMGGLVSVCLVLITIALLALDDNDYRRIVTRAATSLTGYAITVDGPFSLSLSSEPLLSAQTIRFAMGPSGNRPPITTIGYLRIRIALWPLVTGTLVFKELLVEDAIMAIELDAKGAPDDHHAFSWKTRPDIRIPIFESVRLHNIQLELIDSGANRRSEVRLRQFSIDVIRSSGALLIAGNGKISNEDFFINGQLGALDVIFNGDQPYPLALTVRSTGFQVSAAGSVENILKGEGLALQLSGAADELSNVLKLLNIESPPLGHLNFQATISRDVATPRLSDLSVTLSGDPRLEFTIEGAVDEATSGQGSDLRFAGSCSNPKLLRWMTPAYLPEVQRIHVTGELRETDGRLALEKLTFQADAAQELSATAGGRIGLGESIEALSITDMAIDIALSMPTPDILRPYGIGWPTDMGPLSARGRLVGSLNSLALEDIFFEAGGRGPLRVNARGRIGQLTTRPGHVSAVSQVDLSVTLQAETTRSLASGFGMTIPELGAVSLNTRIKGALDRFQLTEIDGRTSSAQGLQISLAGLIDVERHPESGLLGKLDVRTSIAAPSVNVAAAPFGAVDLPDLKPFRADGRIGGSFEALSLNQLMLSAGRSGPLRIDITGAIDRLPLDDRQASGVKLQALIAADSTAALSEVLGSSIPDFGPCKATAHIGDRNGTYGARKLDVVIGNEKAPALTATGRIASLFKTDGVFIDGIDLTAVARNFPLQPLTALLESKPPDLGALSGRFQIAGNPAQLSLSKADLSILSPQGLRIEAAGGIRRIQTKHGKPLAGVEFSLTAEAPGWFALPVLAGFDLPDLGPIKMKAAINDRSGSLDVETFEIHAGKPKQDLLRLQGQIRRIGIMKRMALEATVDTASLPWVTHYWQPAEAINVPLKGAIRAAGDGDGIRIDEIRLATAGRERLAINARGRILHLSEPAAVDLMLEANVSDPRVIESMTGISLPPFSPAALNGRINGNAKKAGFSGKTQFGDTVFESTVNAAFAGPRPLIVVKLASESVRLEHIGMVPQSSPEPAAFPPTSQPTVKGPLFDDTPFPTDRLKSVDLIFSIEAGKLIGRNVNIENLDLDVTIENGRLRIFPASMVYAAGLTEFDLTFDASGSTPVFDLKIFGEDIDIQDLLAAAHEPIVLSGELSLVVDLQSIGRSKRELASNLVGEFSLALENGRLRRIVNFLSTDALNLVFATADRRQHVDMNCLVSKIQFQDGVGDIDVFLMDTPRVRARAAGNVNLASERIDIVINPEQKQRLFRRQASAVRINGPLTRPAVRVLPLVEAAELYGTILMPYIFLPERVLGNLWYLIRRDSNASPCVREFGSP